MANLIEKIWRFISEKSAESSWVVYKDYLKIHPSVIIDPVASIKIFNPKKPPKISIEIGEGSHIFSSFNLLRPHAKIKIGKNCQIGAVNFISAQNIEIGDDVIMAWGITVIDSDNHSLYWQERKDDVERCRKDYLATEGFDLARSHDWKKVKIEPVKICDKVFIGFNTIILKGVTIGEGAIIGAGSVVSSDIKPCHIAAGNPCKHIRKISQKR